MISLKKIINSDKRVLLVSFLAGLFLVSMIFFLAGFKGKRYYFDFRISGSKDYVVEVRKLHGDRYRSKLQIYVEELLLGSSIQRAEPVFPVGTRVLFCFERAGKAYINLSEEAVSRVSDYEIEKEMAAGGKQEETAIYSRYQLLKQNVSKNFPEVKDVILYIDSNPVFQEAIPAE